jgi:hypothetical protein
MPSLTQLTRQFDAALNQFKAMDLGMSDAERYPSGLMTEFLGGRAQAPVMVPLLNGAVGKMPERTATQLLKTRRAPVVMKKTGHGDEIRVSYRKKAMPDAGRREATAYYTDDVKDARGTAAHLVRQARKGQAFSEFNRPRDGDGQFVANVTGGADPVTMRQAYGPDPKKSKLLAPGAAAAALAGTAGLLGTKSGRVMAIKGAKGASRMVRSAVTGIDRKLKGRSTERYPVMGSRAPKGKPGFGETLMRQRMRGD